MSGAEEVVKGVAQVDLAADPNEVRKAKEAARKAAKEEKAKAMASKKDKDAGAGKGKETGEGLQCTKEEDFSEWYSQAVVKSEFIDYYEVSGCYILRPSSYFVWSKIQSFFDDEIKRLGVRNSYFPLFVSRAALEAEADHIEGFAPEVAWVTRSGKSELSEPLAIRPTSETIMYPAFGRWIRSHRDLPLRLNQWSNVVRWEFKHPVPFIRSREFLWQEGHSAFATKEDAGVEVLQILELYRRVYEELLAVPVVKGTKSEKEKFAGGDYTTTVEGYIPGNGRAIQAATSHCLGQNFAKIFNIQFENEAGAKQLVWQNSWGLTTRSIGVMIMVHGDNSGLVIPPRVAEFQVVIVTIPKGKMEDSAREAMSGKARELASTLQAAGIRVHFDDRDNYTPGFKYNYWELRGACIRMEIGPKDMESGNVVLVRRDDRSKTVASWNGLAESVHATLEKMQSDLFERAKKERDDHLKMESSWQGFMTALNARNIVMCPWCEKVECEEAVKKRSATDSTGIEGTDAAALTGSAKTLCIPHLQPELAADAICFACGDKAKSWTLWGRSY